MKLDLKTIYHTTLITPIGQLLVTSSDRGLVRVILPNENRLDPISDRQKHFPNAILLESKERNREVINQLLEYFNGTRKVFSLPIDLRGTDFQKSVWEAVRKVPYGQTRSYGDIAKAIGNPRASRAVGAANGANPISIVIPCHRIIGSDGSMTGFGGGIPLKQKLLDLEKKS